MYQEKIFETHVPSIFFGQQTNLWFGAGHTIPSPDDGDMISSLISTRHPPYTVLSSLPIKYMMNHQKLLAFILVGFTFFFIYGSIFLSSVVSPSTIKLTPLLLLLSLSVNMIIFCGIAILGNILIYDINFEGSFRELFFSREKIVFSLVTGVSFSFFVIIGLAFIFTLLHYGGISLPENPLGDEIAESITLPLLFLVPLLSSISEEVFFRGFLQPKLINGTTPLLGITFTSILFGIAHFSYGNPLQVFIPFLLGLGFGFILFKTKNIIAPISAHFTFNFIQLAIVFVS